MKIQGDTQCVIPLSIYYKQDGKTFEELYNEKYDCFEATIKIIYGEGEKMWDKCQWENKSVPPIQGMVAVQSGKAVMVSPPLG